MHEKLSQAVKLYDKLLEERISNAYNRRTSTIPYSISQQLPQITSPAPSGVGNLYPSITSPSTQSSSIYPYPIASAPAAPHSTYYLPPQQNTTTNAPIQATQYVMQPLLQSDIGITGGTQQNQIIQQQQQLPAQAPYGFTNTTSQVSQAPAAPISNEATDNNTTTSNNIGNEGENNNAASATTTVQGYVPQTNSIPVYAPQYPNFMGEIG